MAPFDLGDELWDNFMRGVARGAYSLLLGAGASRGGLDSLGEPLPLSSELADDLITEFGLEAEAGSLTLVRAYEAAERRGAGRNYPSVDSYLYERFTGCTPPLWLQELVRIRWRRIYSLNIDDTVDAAYIDGRDERVQRLRPTHWSHSYFDVDSVSEVSLVYLHGRARLLGHDDTNNLVFGLAQYLDATTKQHAWHRIFGDTFQRDPYVVVGATLSEEIDLAAILRRGNSSWELQNYPSLVVLPQIDPILEDELKSYGLVPIRATGAEVFAEIARAHPGYLAALPSPPGAIGASPLALRFLSQFSQLEATPEPERDRRHDFYGGDEPTWQDIVRDRDARFHIVEGAVDAARKGLPPHALPRVVCIHGMPFTGKSAALLRTGRELLADGADVFRFRGEERVNVAAVVNWAQNAKRLVLLFDGMADFVAEFVDLVVAAKEQGLGIVILGAERETRVKALSDRIPADDLVVTEATCAEALTDDDINALIGKLREAGRLGRISQRDRGGQLVYFRRESDRQLFSAMEGLEHATSFTDRLRSSWSSVRSPTMRDVYAGTAMVHTVGYEVPIDLAARASDTSVRSIVSTVKSDAAVADLIILRPHALATRQRTLASLFVERALDRSQRYDLSSRIALAIAPHVTPVTISHRTVYARVAGQIMDERILSDWIGVERLEEWYEAQRPAHGWNARFWEQRALAATRIDAWDRAESYAEQAAALHADSFTLNTLGTVLFRKALTVTHPGSEARWGYYRRATSALVESRRQGVNRFMHPYITFFEYALRLAEEERRAGGVPPAYVLREWDDWVLRARNSAVFANPELHSQLEQYVGAWLMQAAQ